eukprot:TRINITY_DN18075_c0_g1_i4.p3 TRINITY_DN18075_c0_g1~~TRINITY_DN18075_c0_g1_i4.p3  ORF type:complete len:147 (-),score=29.48 TRINITY_DN18075_c0_g1_i4:814-1254(-)
MKDTAAVRTNSTISMSPSVPVTLCADNNIFAVTAVSTSTAESSAGNGRTPGCPVYLAAKCAAGTATQSKHTAFDRARELAPLRADGARRCALLAHEATTRADNANDRANPVTPSCGSIPLTVHAASQAAPADTDPSSTKVQVSAQC